MGDNPQHPGKPDDPDHAPTQVVWERIVVRQSSIWCPPTDVYQADNRLIVIIEVAGMRDGDFQIVLQNRRLIVGGVRKQVVEGVQLAYHQLEIPRGEFRTEVQLPWNVQHDQVSATYRDGLLRIELPQAQAQQIHIINVSADQERQS